MMRLRKSHTSAFKIALVAQALENPEDLIRIFHIEARTVIAYIENNLIIFTNTADLNNRL